MTGAYEHLQHLTRDGADVLYIASYDWDCVRGHVIGLAKDVRLHVRSQSTGLLLCSETAETSVEDDPAIQAQVRGFAPVTHKSRCR
jgi:hypothetical protein